MVLGGWVWAFGGELCRIAGVHADYFQNMGDLLPFRVVARPCASYTDLLYAPNCASAVLLPSASIEDYFKLEGAGLLNMGSGYVTTPEYRVRLGQRDLSIIIYYVEIRDTNILLSHYMAITQLPMPMPVPVSFLL
jgi:hypothetical protein